jgi:hypothetical protein
MISALIEEAPLTNGMIKDLCADSNIRSEEAPPTCGMIKNKEISNDGVR